ncbi:MAG: chromosome segregation protein SMC [Firmicutes bacterium HGW-Firmicutes-2]|jgi:chromosome segregation ATPase|nr:MAG: chromosome segregation protein SMC [Firmicutes bacterium HGW-Firmicutes-2]
MSLKINRLEIENVKRIKAVKLEPTKNGLTVIGGNNRQGKTSILDSIAWVLGGEKYRPSNPQREGSVIPPNLQIIMSNGLVVERKGKNSSLKVTDPNGGKGGQQLLDEFVEQLAIDLPKFMNSTSKEKANTLLQIIGVGPQLKVLEQKETELYNKRHAMGQVMDQKEKYAKEQVYYPDVPKDLISASDLIKQQQEILAKNGENNRKRDKAEKIQENIYLMNRQIMQTQETLKAIQEKLEKENAELALLNDDLATAKKSLIDLQDESTEELENNINNIDAINQKIRSNLDKEKAEDDALQYKQQYSKLSAEIDEVRKAKADLLNNAELPLPGLTVDDGDLLYNGSKWDGMSSADQLKVATAIVRKLNPKCGFVLLDKLEQMDLQTLTEFGSWLEQEDLQAIATRVSTGGECSIIIDDGYVLGDEVSSIKEEVATINTNQWKEGQF